MDITTTIHCDMENNVKFSLSEIKELKYFNNEIKKYRVLQIGPNVDIFLNEGQAETLCEVMEKAMYDEPTYQQLVDENARLMYIIEKLTEKLQEKEDSIEDHPMFWDVL